jgi:transposase
VILGALDALDAVEAWWAEQQPTADPLVAAQVAPCLATAQQVRAQDVTPRETGQPVLRQGVARERRISVEDAEMRHGRKSRSMRVDGYKRHILRDLDQGVIRAVGVTAANRPEAAVTDDLLVDLHAQGLTLADLDELDELQIDRAYLSSSWVRDRPPGLRITCKAWPVRNGDRFPKTAFVLDWERQTLRCPAGAVMPVVPGGVVHYPATTCAACALRALYRQSCGAQRRDPSRRAAARRVACAPTDGTGPRPAA